MSSSIRILSADVEEQYIEIIVENLEFDEEGESAISYNALQMKSEKALSIGSTGWERIKVMIHHPLTTIYVDLPDYIVNETLLEELSTALNQSLRDLRQLHIEASMSIPARSFVSFAAMCSIDNLKLVGWLMDHNIVSNECFANMSIVEIHNKGPLIECPDLTRLNQLKPINGSTISLINVLPKISSAEIKRFAESVKTIKVEVTLEMELIKLVNLQKERGFYMKPVDENTHRMMYGKALFNINVHY